MRNSFHEFLALHRGKGLSLRELGDRFRKLSEVDVNRLKSMAAKHSKKGKNGNKKKKPPARRRISVYWPSEQAWFKGWMNTRQTSTDQNHIKYDDGDKGYIYLPHTRYVFLDEEREQVSSDDTLLDPSGDLPPAAAAAPFSFDSNAQMLVNACNVCSDKDNFKFAADLLKRGQMSIARWMDFVGHLLPSHSLDDILCTLGDDNYDIAVERIVEVRRAIS